MHTYKKLAAVAASTVLAALVAGCGSESGSSEAADFNDADVSFAQQMIPHHAQAVDMANLAEGRSANPEVLQLADDISRAQGPEIETMTVWLEEWDADVPSTDMSEMDHSSMGSMDGMMSEDDMSALEGAEGPEFDRLFLDMMIEHHEGAIEMAQSEQDDGQNSDAVELAGDIEETQGVEIATMQELLSSF